MNGFPEKAPLPENEMERLINLSEFDLDYTTQKDTFNDLTTLAAKVAGTTYSSINILDNCTQWTIAGVGMPIDQLPKEDTVCQFTIANGSELEVRDLSAEPRFGQLAFIKRNPHLKYYLGIPVTTSEGHNIGALCLLDNEPRQMDPEKIELLKLISGQVISRLKAISEIEKLKTEVRESKTTNLKVAHDIRGPLSGIVSLAEFITQQGENNKLEDVLQLISIVYKGSNSLLDLAEEILGEEKQHAYAKKEDAFTLGIFKEKLLKLYLPQTLAKKIAFEVNVNAEKQQSAICKNKLMQVAGNLISNAIKFTPENGRVAVTLDITTDENGPVLHLIVSDTGVGLSAEAIKNILEGDVKSKAGTEGETGYGFGLSLVKHLAGSLDGKMQIISKEGEGATFHIMLPQQARWVH